MSRWLTLSLSLSVYVLLCAGVLVSPRRRWNIIIFIWTLIKSNRRINQNKREKTTVGSLKSNRFSKFYRRQIVCRRFAPHTNTKCFANFTKTTFSFSRRHFNLFEICRNAQASVTSKMKWNFCRFITRSDANPMECERQEKGTDSTPKEVTDWPNQPFSFRCTKWFQRWITRKFIRTWITWWDDERCQVDGRHMHT